MSSVAAAADAPEEFAALADDAVDDFMSAPSFLSIRYIPKAMTHSEHSQLPLLSPGVQYKLDSKLSWGP